MALAALQETLRCSLGVGSRSAQRARATRGAAEPIDCITQPGFPAPRPAVRPSENWIGTVTLPQLYQRWPPAQPIPAGWRQATPQEARGIPPTPRGPIRVSASGLSDVDRLVALSTAELATAGVAARRPRRAPREARFPRAARVPRPPREARLPREARAPRPPRRARGPKLARFPRAPRKPRAPYQKTRYSVGWCKRPGCFCWTPAGCIGPEMLLAVKAAGLLVTAAECYPGPCYDYAACVTHRCFSDVSCILQTILRFWVTQYHAAVTYATPPVTAAVAAVRRPGLRLLIPGPLLPATMPAPAAGVPADNRIGCPAGSYWGIGLTGIRCVPDGSGAPPASHGDLVYFGIIPGP